jgi:acetylornithine deacetylase/succinyl-diaminopimelate desuccinylase-like protein
MATMVHGPVTIDPDHAVIQAARKAIDELGQTQQPLTIVPGWTDASLLSREAGIPTIIWGPGEINLAHSPEENIKLEDVYLAAELYASAALHFMNTA